MRRDFIKFFKAIMLDIALEETMEMKGNVNGPKKLNVFGASYLYPIFGRFGLIKIEGE